MGAFMEEQMVVCIVRIFCSYGIISVLRNVLLVLTLKIINAFLVLILVKFVPTKISVHSVNKGSIKKEISAWSLICVQKEDTQTMKQWNAKNVTNPALPATVQHTNNVHPASTQRDI